MFKIALFALASGAAAVSRNGKDQQWKVAAVGPEDADSAMVQKDSAYEIGDSLEAIGEWVEKTYGKSSFVEISPHGHELETDAASMLQVESEVDDAKDYWINLSTGWKIAICVIVGVVGSLIFCLLWKACGCYCASFMLVATAIAVVVLIVIFVIKDKSEDITS